MAILNAGLGSLEHDGSPINPTVDLTTNTAFFDNNYARRALDWRNNNGNAYLWHTPLNTIRQTPLMSVRCMLWLPSSGPGVEIFPIISLTTTGGRLLSLTGIDTLTAQWRHDSDPTSTDAALDAFIPRDTLFELTMTMEVGQPARWYVDGVLVYEASSGVYQGDVGGNFEFGGPSGSRCYTLMRNARDTSCYISEPAVGTQDMRGLRVRDLIYQRRTDGQVGSTPSVVSGSADPLDLQEPGSSSRWNLNSDTDYLGFESTPHGPTPAIPPLGILVSAAKNGQSLNIAGTVDNTSAPITDPVEGQLQIASIGRTPTDGESIGQILTSHPATTGGKVIEDSDFASPASIGVLRSSSLANADIYSMEQVLLYQEAPADPLDGALLTQSVSYTVQQDQDFLQDLFGLKTSQAVSYTVSQDLAFLAPLFGPRNSQSASYTVSRQTVEPRISQGVSYTVGTVGEQPRSTQGVSYTVSRDDEFLATTLGPRLSSSVSYTVIGNGPEPSLTQAVSYTVGRLGDLPQMSSAVSYTILGVGDPAAIIQGVSYTVLAPAPPAPYTSTIIIGRSRY